MDPISILSVATAVVTFTDFSAKIISRCREIRDTGEGAPKELVNLTTAAEDLLNASASTQDKLKDLRAKYHDHADTLERLTLQCATMDKKIKDFSAKLNVQSQGLLKKYSSTVVVAVRSSWSQAELEDWDRQLSRLREQIMLVVLTCIWEDTKLARERAGQTDEATRKILEGISRIGYNVDAVKTIITRTKNGIPLDEDGNPPQIAASLWETTGFIDFQKDVRLVHLPQSSNLDPNTDTKILQSLRFHEISDRVDRIATAYPQTYEWVFQRHAQDGNNMQHLQDTGFVPWLQNQNRTIFWITGVPASGKSTLMKFISNNDSLEENLRIWAGSYRLHIATFYFWGPGSAIQRSRNGLLRSLLHQLLSQRPESISVVALRRKMFFSLASTSQVHPEWEWTELCECFFRFASYAQQTRSRVALFIDGLDEYGGNTEELVSFLLDLHRDFDLKLCVSSRPWNVFADAFCQSPSLTMEKINGPDIDIYVEQKLCKSPAIKDLLIVIPEEIDKLANEIKIKANGVFLWVVLVVEQLLQTSREDPRLPSIREVFDSLPDELENLYNKILGQIGPEKKLVASRLYRLVMEWKRNWNGQMPTTFLWLAINITDPTEWLVYPPPVNIEGIVKLLDRLLRGHTRGILQISKSVNTEPGEEYTVDFLHRTAFEWLRMENNWSQICEQGGADYQAMLYILRVLVSQICSTTMSPTPEHKQRLSRIFMLSREIPDTADGRIQVVKIIDDIDEKCFHSLATSGTRFLHPFPRLRVESWPSMDTSKFNTMRCAAAWSSDTYLHGKLDILGISGKRNFLLRRTESELQPVLEIAMCSFTTELYATDQDFKYRRLTFWHASKRLHTIQILLQRGTKIIRSQCQKLAISLKDGNEVEKLYAQVLQEARSSRNTAASLEKQLAEHFPVTSVAPDRLRHEFPDYFISNVNGFSTRYF